MIGIGLVLNQISGPSLVHRFSVSTKPAILINMAFAVLLNFLARNCILFKE